MNALLVFGATYISVFMLGLQSLNVNQGQYCAAIVTSFFIGSGHILLYRYMPGAALDALAGYYLGGMAGIASSIWFHKRAKAWISAWSDRRRQHAEKRAETCGRCNWHRVTDKCWRKDCPNNSTY